MKKKAKLIIIILVTAVLVCVVATAICLNFHKIYLFCERNGLFCREVTISEVSPQGTRTYSLSELEEMPNVKLDQSLTLVNTQYTLSDSFIPEISEYKSTTVFMNDCMQGAYAALSTAVMERTGKKLYVSSDFRSAEEQEALYLEDPLTATRVGASEHQTGLALDVYVARYAGDSFIKSRAGRFVNSECWKYGFIIRYPSHAEDVTLIRFEPWHIRYVGSPHAEIIYNNHITLEEYVTSLDIGQWYEAKGYLVCRQSLDSQGRLGLPESFESAVISPDNTGYYIVTVKMDSQITD